MDFHTFFILNEARFRDSKQVLHLADFPMFSVFMDKDTQDKEGIPWEQRKENLKGIEPFLVKAKSMIQKMGFSSMHSNIVFKDIKDIVNPNTGGKIGGYATSKGKYMVVDSKYMVNQPSDYLLNTIVHEWAHLWMFQNSKGFKRAVKEFYREIRQGTLTTFPFNREQLYRGNLAALTSLGYSMDKDNGVWDSMKRSFVNGIHSAYYVKHTIAIPDPESPWDIPNPYILEDVTYQIKKSIEYILKYDFKVNFNEHETFINNVALEASKLLFPIINQKVDHIVEDELYIKRSNEQYGENETFENLDKYLENIYMDNDIFSDVEMYIYAAIVKLVATTKINRWSSDLSGKEFNEDREKIANLVGWVNEYGMSNDDEIWATGVEQFLDLPPEHRKSILHLMKIQGERQAPNRSKRRYQAIKANS
jgi:hypothetical protein